jgi:hypothetical protein
MHQINDLDLKETNLLSRGVILKYSEISAYSHTDHQINSAETNAIWSVLSYVLGIGDRHLGNILIREEDSTICFVDFEMILKIGLKQPIPELIDIRMTDIIRFFHGSFDLFGIFASNFRHVTKVLFGGKNIAKTKNQHFTKAHPTHEINLFEENLRIFCNGFPEDGLSRQDLFLFGVNRALNLFKILQTPGGINELIHTNTDSGTYQKMFRGWDPYA